MIPFLKKFEATVRSCTQNGVRGGSATVHFPIWHQEIRDILVLKNNKGTEDEKPGLSAEGAHIQIVSIQDGGGLKDEGFKAAAADSPA